MTYNSNPFLKPETTTSWEIGGEQKLWKGGVFKATYFDNDVNDLIYQYNVNSTTVNKVNVGKANIRGTSSPWSRGSTTGFTFSSTTPTIRQRY